MSIELIRSWHVDPLGLVVRGLRVKGSGLNACEVLGLGLWGKGGGGYRVVSLTDKLFECIWGGNGVWLHILRISSVNRKHNSTSISLNFPDCVPSVGRRVIARSILALELVL